MGQYTQTQCSYCVTSAPWEAAQKVWFDRKERQNKGIHTHTHTQAYWHAYKGRMSVSLCPNECGQALGGFLLILTAAQQDGDRERPATAPSAHRPPNSLPLLALTHPDTDHGPHLALMTRAVLQIPQHSSRSVALHVLQNKKHARSRDDN